MKKLMMASILLACTFGSAFAGCEGAYSNYIRSAQKRESGRRKYNAEVVGLQLTGTGVGAYIATDLSSKAILSSTAEVDSTVLSTAVVPFFSVGLFLGGATSVKIAEDYVDGDKSASEFENIKELTGALRLIKEAHAGEGTILESYMPLIWKELNTTITVANFAEAINNLNNENTFCQNPNELSARKGIVFRAINALRVENKNEI